MTLKPPNIMNNICYFYEIHFIILKKSHFGINNKKGDSLESPQTKVMKIG